MNGAARAAHDIAGVLRLAALFAALVGASSARAQSPQFELEWSAPSGCMNAERARAAIRELIAQGAADDGIATEVSVHIEGSDADGYLAELEIERGDEEGERTLRGTRCDDVSAAATLVIAMVIDPSAVERLPEPKPSAKPAASEPVEGASAPGEPARFSLGLELLGDLGSAPRATLGAALTLGLHATPRLRFDLAGVVLLPQRENAGPTPLSSTLLALYAGQLRGCYALADELAGMLALEGCATAELGVSRGDPQGISNGGPSSALWGAGFLGLGLRQASRSGLQLGGMAELGLPIFRPVYEIDGYGRVFRASPVLARLSLQVRWLFP